MVAQAATPRPPGRRYLGTVAARPPGVDQLKVETEWESRGAKGQTKLSVHDDLFQPRRHTASGVPLLIARAARFVTCRGDVSRSVIQRPPNGSGAAVAPRAAPIRWTSRWSWMREASRGRSDEDPGRRARASLRSASPRSPRTPRLTVALGLTVTCRDGRRIRRRNHRECRGSLSMSRRRGGWRFPVPGFCARTVAAGSSNRRGRLVARLRHQGPR